MTAAKHDSEALFDSRKPRTEFAEQVSSSRESLKKNSIWEIFVNRRCLGVAPSRDTKLHQHVMDYPEPL